MPERKWIRTCQSCRYERVSKPPAEYKNGSWRDIKCPKCHSIDFDYGTWESRQETSPGDEDDDES